MVFQDAALFPHLNVQQNLDFGAKRSKSKSAGTENLIELLGIGHLLSRRTDTLSGGEKTARGDCTRTVLGTATAAAR